MLRRVLAHLVVLVLLGSLTAQSTSASPGPTTSPTPASMAPTVSVSLPHVTWSPPAQVAVVHPPPRVRIAPDPPEAALESATPTVEDAKAWALETLGPREAYCLDRIVWHESRWRPTVWNTKGSGAYGLVQAKPGSKMASAGADYMTNPITQLRWAIAYGTRKYGSLCGAWAFWVEHGWW